MTTHPELPYEQAKNKEYLDKLERKLQRNPFAAVARNVMWIDSVDHQIKAAGHHHPLLGRVGCATDDPELRDFYIGSRFIQDDDIQTYSWAAPIARLFFQPDPDGSDNVVVRRTFAHVLTDISDLDDEWVREGVPSPFVARELSVPAPPRAAESRRSPRRLRKDAKEQSDAVPEVDAPTPHPPPRSAPPSSIPAQRPADAQGRRSADPRHGMRAPEAVLKRLSSPRGRHLTSVLALLQPDQHKYVTWSPTQNLAVQGHPGTGKTVVAAYRAAYLVNPALYDHGGSLEGRSTKPLRVLVLGPTAGYVDHVHELIKPLAPTGHVRVTHLAEVLAETTGLKNSWPGAIGGEHNDVDEQARYLAARAARFYETQHSWRVGGGSRRENIRAVYELIAGNGTKGLQLVEDAHQIEWMRNLPPFEQAFRRRYLPLLAQCRLAYLPIPDAEKFDHIIVDEAQDVSPIEWNVLDQHMRRDGHWTLVGDMNQRRSDVTYGSWREIAEHLALTAEYDFEPHVMDRGYRSTGAVLKFADRLLPARERGNQTVQEDGSPVGVHRVSQAGKLWTRAVDEAASLAVKHSEGTTAIITVSPGEMIGELGRRGWRRSGKGFDLWKRGERHLRVLPPEEARGLEFDAVVVVEPGSFPENLGRLGQLYTSLTRANRELAVVWHRDLPDALRRAARS